MPSENLKKDYSEYMSRKYGTMAELCAMAEIFNFGFCVIRKHDHTNYSCYDYGSVSGMSLHKPLAVVHLLFTGDTGEGHFRYLRQKDNTQNEVEPGRYKLVEAYTSSKFTSIAPLNFATMNDDEIDVEADRNGEDCATASDSSFEDFVILLARCRSNIRVLKRVPRGARILAANTLAHCLEECLASPDLATKWKNLLTFAYTSLRVPERVNNVSLSTLVKRNLTNPTLKFTKPTKKKPTISLSKRVEGKVAEGNIKGAVKILASTDTLAPQNESTLSQLKAKHPPPSREMAFPDPPDKTSQPLVVTEKETFFSIKSFPNGSGSGIDGILPQHLKDLTLPSTGEAGIRLLKSDRNKRQILKLKRQIKT